MRLSRFSALTFFTLLLPLVAFAGGPVALEPDFVISQEHPGFTHPTQVTFAPDGRLFVAIQTGQIYAFEYTAGGINGGPTLVANNVGSLLLGIGFDADGMLYASSNEGAFDTGFLARLRDVNDDGVYETQDKFVTGLPNRGHHNDQLAIDGHVLYVGLGSRNDDGDIDDVKPIPAATILRVDLQAVDFLSPTNLPEVYAFGLRNAFGIALDDQGRLWCGDNGRDSPLSPEKLHLVVPGAHHGFPVETAPPDAIDPVTTLGLGTSANGLDFYPAAARWGSSYAGNIFQSRFDFELNDPQGVGQDVVRIELDEAIPGAPTASVSVFARGFVRPLDVEVDPFGNLVVMEYGPYSGATPGGLYRISAIVGGDDDRDGDVDLQDFAALQRCFTGDFPTGLEPACRHFDRNDDERINVADFVSFLTVFAGN